MSPKGVLLDFEEALGQAFEHVFPCASVLGDFFHFVQANIRRVGELGHKHLAHDVGEALNKVWYAKTKADFDNEVVQFLEEWEDKVPGYTTYFRNNWLNRYHPEKWASYARADDAPSGKNAL